MESVGLWDATAVVLDVDENILEKDVVVVNDGVDDSCVAAPGPLPKAGTDPTCFDAAGEDAAAVSSALD